MAKKYHPFQRINNFLSDVYTNATNTEYHDNTLEYMKHLLYWTTLQEEINYPRSKGFSGIKLPFCRYYEAIYSTQPNPGFSIADVERRCNNHNQTGPWLYEIQNAPEYYLYW